MRTIGRNAASTGLGFVCFAWVLAFASSERGYCEPAAPTLQGGRTTEEEVIARCTLPSEVVGANFESGRAGWEIMPQEAGNGEVILSKRNELGLLNFAATPFEFHGKRYTRASKVSGR